MIPKKGKDISSPESYRPITLLDCIGKFLKKLVNERLTYFLVSNKKISMYQSGFRKFRSTSDQALRLIQSVREGFNSYFYTAALFFDISKAFDRAWHYGIL